MFGRNKKLKKTVRITWYWDRIRGVWLDDEQLFAAPNKLVEKCDNPFKHHKEHRDCCHIEETTIRLAEDKALTLAETIVLGKQHDDHEDN